MMTTMAALFGTLPIALSLGAGAESRRPLGIAVVGGLFFSQFITLFITPVVYTYLDAARSRVAGMAARTARAEWQSRTATGGWQMKPMKTLAKRTGVALAVALVAIQFVPVTRTNPAISTEMPATPELRAVLRRACYDCHSNETVWPWYSRVAPVSWLLAHDVNDGRAKLNFSAWDRMAATQQAKRVRESGRNVQEGDMPPWYYLPMHPAARLSDADKAVLVAWSRSAGGPEPAER